MTAQLELRVAAVRNSVRRQKLDGLLIQNPISSLYLSGFPCSNSFVLITGRHKFFFTDFRYIEKARSSISHLDVELMPQNGLAGMAARIKKLKLKAVGFEEIISYGQFTNLRQAVDSATELRPSADILRSLRLIKDAAEIKQIAANQRLNERFFQAALADVSAASTENKIRNHILSDMISADCEEAFHSIIATGANSANPHAVPGNSRVKRGSFLLFDMGVKKNFYYSDMTRTVVVEPKVRKQAAEIYEVVRTAQAAALNLVAPGVACKDIDAAARDIISEAGYGDYFGHGLGHGVGLEIHEGPTLNPQSSQILQAGMVITIEPGIYVPGMGGVRIEDLVLVTDTGFKNLTSLPKKLLQIEL